MNSMHYNKWIARGCALTLTLTLFAGVSSLADETIEPALDDAVIVAVSETVQIPANPAIAELPEIPANVLVRFVNWDGQELYSMDLLAGQTLAAPALLSPMRDGFEFLHWCQLQEDAAMQTEDAFVFGQPVQQMLTLQAVYAAKPQAEIAEAHAEPTEAKVDVKAGVPEANDQAADEITEEISVIEFDEEELLFVEFAEQQFEETITDDEVPLAGPAMAQAMERRVNVFSNMGDCINEDEIVTLTGELIGFGDCEVQLQWQYNSGNGWEDLEGATDLTCSFSATTETVNSTWRLAVKLAA